MTSRVYSAIKYRYPKYSTSRTLCPSWSAVMCKYPQTRRIYPIKGDFENTGYVFCPESSTPTANYPLLRDFKNSGYRKSCYTRGLRLQVSGF